MHITNVDLALYDQGGSKFKEFSDKEKKSIIAADGEFASALAANEVDSSTAENARIKRNDLISSAMTAHGFKPEKPDVNTLTSPRNALEIIANALIDEDLGAYDQGGSKFKEFTPEEQNKIIRSDGKMVEALNAKDPLAFKKAQTDRNLAIAEAMTSHQFPLTPRETSLGIPHQQLFPKVNHSCGG